MCVITYLKLCVSEFIQPYCINGSFYKHELVFIEAFLQQRVTVVTYEHIFVLQSAHLWWWPVQAQGSSALFHYHYPLYVRVRTCVCLGVHLGTR